MCRTVLATILLGAELLAITGAQGEIDPLGLFFVHHGVGSEDWSAEGFARLPKQNDSDDRDVERGCYGRNSAKHLSELNKYDST